MGGRRKRTNSDYMFDKNSLPSIKKVNFNNLVTDPDIKKVQKASVVNNVINRTILFTEDNVASSTCDMMGGLVIGDQIGITVDKSDEAIKVIETWNDNINVKHQTVENYLQDSFRDSMINSDALWRIYQNPDLEPKVDLARVSTATLKMDERETLGAIRWIQWAQIPRQQNTVKKFYKSDPIALRQYENVVITIPNETNAVIYTKLFNTAPVSTVLQQLNQKKWAYWFLRKFMEKHWAPFIIATVGDLKNGYMPPNQEAMKNDLTWAAQQIQQIRDFGGAAFPDWVKLTVLDAEVKKANIYLDTIDHYSKEIAIGLHSSITSRDSAGRPAAQQNLATEGWLRNIRTYREIYNIKLRNFYAKVLLPAYDINNIEPGDIKLTFPDIKVDATKDILQSVEIAAKIGAFKDWREMRKILNPVWKHIDAKVTDKEQSDMKDTFLELNAPSRGEGDSPQGRSAGGAAPGAEPKPKPDTAKPKK